MTSTSIHQSLLQPAVLQILRAAGFNAAKPAALDTLTDLAARYVTLLATSTAQNAATLHNTAVPTVQDVRLALSENGALYPQMTPDEEARKGEVEIAGEWFPFEDLRGVERFVDWAHGEVNKEIRRIAGFSGDELSVDQIAAGTDEKVDYLTSLKKHGKADDDIRFQGTLLGQDTELQPVTISGGTESSLAEWLSRLKARSAGFQPNIDNDEGASPAESSTLSSAPLTPGARGGSEDVDVDDATVKVTMGVKTPATTTQTWF